jgi:uncharacterized RDD family membrane protein YckC
MNNPYAPPTAPVSDNSQTNVDELEYAGFWIRVGASIIDSIIIMLITVPLLIWAIGTDAFLGEETTASGLPSIASFFLQYVFPAVWTIWFWIAKQGTPGKMLLSLRIVDAATGDRISTGQAIGRYFAYIPSALVFGLGFLWVAFDRRKQGWHDKLAGTLVVRGR